MGFNSGFKGLKCNGTNKWRENVLDSKWLHIGVKEEIAYKITTVSNMTEKFGKFLYKVKCK